MRANNPRRCTIRSHSPPKYVTLADEPSQDTAILNMTFEEVSFNGEICFRRGCGYVNKILCVSFFAS